MILDAPVGFTKMYFCEEVTTSVKFLIGDEVIGQLNNM